MGDPLILAGAVAPRLRRTAHVLGVPVAGCLNGAQGVARGIDARVAYVAVVAVVIWVVLRRTVGAVGRHTPRVAARALAIRVQPRNSRCVVAAVCLVRAGSGTLRVVRVPVGASTAVDRGVVLRDARVANISAPRGTAEALAPGVCVAGDAVSMT